LDNRPLATQSSPIRGTGEIPDKLKRFSLVDPLVWQMMHRVHR
jgi:hypothetical protein